MKALTIADAPEIILGLQDEIRRSDDARYDHRLHAILLVAEGLSCPEAGRLLGDAPRTVHMWVHRFEEDGLAGLQQKLRPGRPPRLSPTDLRAVNTALRRTPVDYGLGTYLWDGKTLSAFLERERDMSLGVRQCQRLFHQLEFRYRKPRPMVAGLDAEAKEAHKKTPDSRPSR
jgi:transposase